MKVWIATESVDGGWYNQFHGVYATAEVAKTDVANRVRRVLRWTNVDDEDEVHDDVWRDLTEKFTIRLTEVTE